MCFQRAAEIWNSGEEWSELSCVVDVSRDLDDVDEAVIVQEREKISHSSSQSYLFKQDLMVNI